MNLLYRDFWNTLGFILSILIPEYMQSIENAISALLCASWSAIIIICACEQARALFHECFVNRLSPSRLPLHASPKINFANELCRPELRNVKKEWIHYTIMLKVYLYGTSKRPKASSRFKWTAHFFFSKFYKPFCDLRFMKMTTQLTTQNFRTDDSTESAVQRQRVHRE